MLTYSLCMHATAEQVSYARSRSKISMPFTQAWAFWFCPYQIEIEDVDYFHTGMVILVLGDAAPLQHAISCMTVVATSLIF
jgi:hypothetical protein